MSRIQAMATDTKMTPGSRITGFVILDTQAHDGSVQYSRHLMRDISACLRPDGIRVSECHVADSGVAPATIQRHAHGSGEHRSPMERQQLMGAQS